MSSDPDWKCMVRKVGRIPPEVGLCGERIASGGFWWQASTNYRETEVFSCRHAVKFRNRLGSGGTGGIPLWAELKSLVASATESRNGKRITFAAHTRANTRFSKARLLGALGLDTATARIRFLLCEDESDLDSGAAAAEDRTLRDQRWFGKVNPFNVDCIISEITGAEVRLSEVIQILDSSIQLEGGIPDTMMSNLGTRTAAFEIGARDLISLIKCLSPQSFVAPIAEPCPIWLGLGGKPQKDYWLQLPPARGPRIGILTGNSPESGMTLWKDVLECLRGLYSNLSDVLMPEIHVHSLPEMGLSMELVSREEEVWNVVKGGIAGLLDVGCSIVTVACNTTIHFQPRIATLCDRRAARFVSIAEACMPAVRRALKVGPGRRSVGLLGIGPVVDVVGSFSGYKRHLEAAGIEVNPCAADRLAFEVKSRGTKHELVTEFRRLVRERLASESVVVLALTEASVVYRKHLAKAAKKWESAKVFVDPLQELGKYLSFLYLTQGYRESAVCEIPVTYSVEEKVRGRLGWSASDLAMGGE